MTNEEIGVDQIAQAMKAKLAKKSAEGWCGWEHDATNAQISERLRQCVEKGDPIDVANYCMMLAYRGEQILPTS